MIEFEVKCLHIYSNEIYNINLKLKSCYISPICDIWASWDLINVSNQEIFLGWNIYFRVKHIECENMHFWVIKNINDNQIISPNFDMIKVTSTYEIFKVHIFLTAIMLNLTVWIESNSLIYNFHLYILLQKWI